ncbi:MAG: carbohydrate kinase [Pseudomonadota bacterium]
MSDVIFCGEALIDFVPVETDAGTALMPKAGGSPFNAAKAAAMAGGKSYFCGAVSHEFFGDHLVADLEQAGVRTDLVQRLDHLTTLAFVDFASGGPRYAFHDEGTASRNFVPGFGGYTPAPRSILDFGSVSLIGNPAADALADFAVAQSERMLIAIDPNVREGLIADADEWHTRLARMLGVASILKLSDEDLAFMAPGTSMEDYASAMLQHGLALVIITLGEGGAMAFTRDGRAKVPVRRIDMVDTVGAGDTLMGTALVWLTENELTSRAALAGADDDKLAAMLTFSTTAAALNCTRQGCQPPSRQDLEHALRTGARFFSLGD